jgi:hypothetical protein
MDRRELVLVLPLPTDCRIEPARQRPIAGQQRDLHIVGEQPDRGIHHHRLDGQLHPDRPFGRIAIGSHLPAGRKDHVPAPAVVDQQPAVTIGDGKRLDCRDRKPMADRGLLGAWRDQAPAGCQDRETREHRHHPERAGRWRG